MRDVILEFPKYNSSAFLRFRYDGVEKPLRDLHNFLYGKNNGALIYKTKHSGKTHNEHALPLIELARGWWNSNEKPTELDILKWGVLMPIVGISDNQERPKLRKLGRDSSNKCYAHPFQRYRDATGNIFTGEQEIRFELSYEEHLEIAFQHPMCEPIEKYYRKLTREAETGCLEPCRQRRPETNEV